MSSYSNSNEGVSSGDVENQVADLANELQAMKVDMQDNVEFGWL
jgi:hypothetical protein